MAGLGVTSVWMNIGLDSYVLDRLASARAQETLFRGWLRSDGIVIARRPKADAAIQDAEAPDVPWIASLRSQ